MLDIQPPESHVNGGGGGGSGAAGGGQIAVTSSETVGSKRQRRPSVRLGEIGGDQLYESHPRRTVNNNNNNGNNSNNNNNSNKQWKHNQLMSNDHSNNNSNRKESNKASKTRALTNISVTSGAETLDDGDKEVNLDTVAIGSWRLNKDPKKRASTNVTTKRVRSNWVSKIDDTGGGGNVNDNDNDVDVDEDDKYTDGEDIAVGDDDEGYREFHMDNSESPLKEQSPLHSLENLRDGNERNERHVYYNNNDNRRMIRDNHNLLLDGVDLSGPSDTDAREFRNKGRCGGGGEDGVRIWLNSIGLGRYAPVFEIHEVDDEVLPMLTLEDLKDMGISAVGSRRKMFCAIQKLGKGFS